jgi:hypothetical protein
MLKSAITGLDIRLGMPDPYDVMSWLRTRYGNIPGGTPRRQARTRPQGRTSSVNRAKAPERTRAENVFAQTSPTAPTGNRALSDAAYQRALRSISQTIYPSGQVSIAHPRPMDYYASNYDLTPEQRRGLEQRYATPGYTYSTSELQFRNNPAMNEFGYSRVDPSKPATFGWSSTMPQGSMVNNVWTPTQTNTSAMNQAMQRTSPRR